MTLVDIAGMLIWNYVICGQHSEKKTTFGGRQLVIYVNLSSKVIDFLHV